MKRNEVWEKMDEVEEVEGKKWRRNGWHLKGFLEVGWECEARGRKEGMEGKKKQ